MAFNELIKNFSKTRDYMRDFYIYGFKARGDFTAKSARTYDDEKRRIESWLASYVRWENDRNGKRVYVSLDASGIGSNPLYNAWKAKSFTDNDITLHFAILAALEDGQKKTADLTDAVCEITGVAFDTQTVRIKANEYVAEGLILKERIKNNDYYVLSPLTFAALPIDRNRLLEAIRFFQEVLPFGFVGSTILDQERERGHGGFSFKHHYIVHTLEDGVLQELLIAMHDKCSVSFTQQSVRSTKETVIQGVPMQVFVSVQSGRRYVCIYNKRNKFFHTCRIDFIKKVEILEEVSGYDALRAQLNDAIALCWGVSFGTSGRRQKLSMKVFVDEENEGFVLDRLQREGRGGEVSRVDKDTWLYTIELFDVAEMMAWVKSFTGRIISLESTNQEAVDFFYRDMERMAAMYGGVAATAIDGGAAATAINGTAVPTAKNGRKGRGEDGEDET